MNIIRNLAHNPRLARDLAGWTVETPGYARVDGGPLGTSWAVRALRNDTDTVSVYYTLDIDPTLPLSWSATVRAVGGTDLLDVYALWFTEAGLVASPISRHPLQSDVATRVAVHGLVPPAGVRKALLVFLSRPGQAAPAPAIEFSLLMPTQTPTAQPYLDGDAPGWAWDGAAHASPSRGPAGYRPEAELLLGGTRVDWLDLVPGYAESVQSGTVVQTVLGDPSRAPYVTVREGRDARGTLTVHFVRETGLGLPGARAERVWSSLRSGAPHTLQLRDAHAGLTGPLLLVPVGEVRRVRAERAAEAWTVSVDFHRAAP